MTSKKRRNTICRFPALLLAVAVFIGAALPALAAEEVTSTGTFWTHLAQKSPEWIGTVIGTLYPSACPTSPDNLHHGKVLREGSQRGQYWAWCDYCSIEFQVRDRDLDDAYKSQVTNIQNNYGATVIDASGNGLIPLTGWYDCAKEDGWAQSYTDLIVPGDIPAFRGISTASWASVRLKLKFTVSSLGTYQLVFPAISTSHSASYLVLLGTKSSDYVNKSLPKSKSFPAFTSASFTLKPGTDYLAKIYCTTFNAPGNQIIYANASNMAYLLAKQLFPTSDVNVSTDSRVGKFSGNFGYYGDNGQLITADNVQIVNEGDKTIYNPATGAISTVKDWTYDYSNRSYDLTLDTGDKVNVTYGDENVTIKQGDTIYNIYYVVGPTTPDPTPTPSTAPEPTPTNVPTPPPSGNPQPPPTEDPGSGEGGGGSLWEKIWDAIAAFFKFIGDLIGRLLLTLLNFFTGILEHVVGLVDLFGTFGEIVSSLYTWLPTELQTLIAGALAISLALAVISLFRK